MRQPIRIVLVEPEQARNIGAVVRVAANFGLRRVVVVREDGALSAEELREVRVASAGAVDVVEIDVRQTLRSAVKSASGVVGTSGRRRSVTVPVYSSIAYFFRLGAADGADDNSCVAEEVAVLFGRESQGLTAEEISLCHGVLSLPVSPEFPSMNLSHAVAVVLCQALWMSADLEDEAASPQYEASSDNPTERCLASGTVAAAEPEMEQASRDLQEAWLRKIEALSAGAMPPVNLQQLRFLLHRSQPTRDEMALLFNLLKIPR